MNSETTKQAVEAIAAVDSVMRRILNRNLLKYAAGSNVTCPTCGGILDCKSTVVITLRFGATENSVVRCAGCYERQQPNFDELSKRHGHTLETIKGWIEFPAPAQATRKPRVPRNKHTFAERLIAGLLANGWTWDCGYTTSKYRAYSHPEKGVRFVGPSGALRDGSCVTKSYSVGDPSNQSPRYAALLAAGDKALETKGGAQ